MNTVGIEVDTSLAKAGADSFKASTDEMRADANRLKAAIKDVESGFNDLRNAAKMDGAAQGLRDLAAAATGAVTEVKRLSAEMRAAAEPVTMRLLTDGREKVAGLIADLRGVAREAEADAAAMLTVEQATRRAVAEGARLREQFALIAQQRTSLLSGSGPNSSQLALPAPAQSHASPILDLTPITAETTALERLREMASSAATAISGVFASVSTAARTSISEASAANAKLREIALAGKEASAALAEAIATANLGVKASRDAMMADLARSLQYETGLTFAEAQKQVGIKKSAIAEIEAATKAGYAQVAREQIAQQAGINEKLAAMATEANDSLLAKAMRTATGIGEAFSGAMTNVRESFAKTRVAASADMDAIASKARSSASASAGGMGGGNGNDASRARWVARAAEAKTLNQGLRDLTHAYSGLIPVVIAFGAIHIADNVAKGR